MAWVGRYCVLQVHEYEARFAKGKLQSSSLTLDPAALPNDHSIHTYHKRVSQMLPNDREKLSVVMPMQASLWQGAYHLQVCYHPSWTSTINVKIALGCCSYAKCLASVLAYGAGHRSTFRNSSQSLLLSSVEWPTSLSYQKTRLKSYDLNSRFPSPFAVQV